MAASAPALRAPRRAGCLVPYGNATHGSGGDEIANSKGLVHVRAPAQDHPLNHKSCGSDA